MPSQPLTDPPPARAALLERGERLLWWGRPYPGLALRRRDALLIPFAAAWLGLAVYWQAEATAREPGPGATLFGAAFIAIGLYMLAGRFLVEAWRRRRTLYAVSARRVIILAPPLKTVLLLRELGKCRIGAEPGGRRSLAFGREMLMRLQFGWRRGFISRRPECFELVEDADGALAAIHAAQAGKAAA